MIWVLACLCLVLGVALGVAVFLLVTLGKTLIKLEDAVPECLDELDQRYAAIGEILKTPVGSDDPFVKKVLAEIEMSQNAILHVANKIGAVLEQPEPKEKR